LTDTDKYLYRKIHKLKQLWKGKQCKYSQTKLPWFSCLLWQSARKWGGLILPCLRAHTGCHV